MKDITKIKQQKPESPRVTLTWHACKYRVHEGCPPVAYYIPYISTSRTLSDTGVHRHKRFKGEWTTQLQFHTVLTHRATVLEPRSKDPENMFIS